MCKKTKRPKRHIDDLTWMSRCCWECTKAQCSATFQSVSVPVSDPSYWSHGRSALSFFFYQYDAADAETLEVQAVSILHASRIARMLRRRLVGTVGLDKRRMFISQ